MADAPAAVWAEIDAQLDAEVADWQRAVVRWMRQHHPDDVAKSWEGGLGEGTLSGGATVPMEHKSADDDDDEDDDVDPPDADPDSTDPHADLQERSELIADFLYHLYGDDALKHLDAVTKGWRGGSPTLDEIAQAAGWRGPLTYLESLTVWKDWKESDHPRGKGGRFMPRGSAEAVSAAKQAVGNVLAGKGGDAKEVANHLAILTVKQLRELHKANGVKSIPSHIVREHLVQAVRDKLTPAVGRKTEPAKGNGSANDDVNSVPEAQPQTPEMSPQTPEPAAAEPKSDDPANSPNLYPLRAAGALIVADHDTPVVQAHLKALATIPPHIHNQITKAGFKGFYVGNKPMTELDHNGCMKGITPRGWPSNMTWDQIAGCASVGSGTACAGKGSGHSISGSVALHEYGHIVGDCLKLDDSSELKEIHKELYPKLNPYLRQDGPGGTAGCQELFAELFASRMISRASAEKSFSKAAVDWLERELKL